MVDGQKVQELRLWSVVWSVEAAGDAVRARVRVRHAQSAPCCPKQFLMRKAIRANFPHALKEEAPLLPFFL
jgi:hypothetical protein